MWCVFAKHLFCARYCPNIGAATRQEPAGSWQVPRVGAGEKINVNQIHPASRLTRCSLQAVISEHIYSQMSGTVHMNSGGRTGESIDGIFDKEKQIQMLWLSKLFPKNKYEVWPSLNQLSQSPLLCDMDQIPQPLSTSRAIDHRQTGRDELMPWLLESLRNLFQGWEEPAGAPPPITWRHTDFTLFPRLFLTPCLASCCPLWHNAPSPRLYLANSYSFCKIQLLSRTYCIMLGVCWKPFVCLLPPTGL